MQIKHNGRPVLYAHQVIPERPMQWGEREKAFSHEYQHCRFALEDALRKNSDLEIEVQQLRRENEFLLRMVNAEDPPCNE